MNYSRDKKKNNTKTILRSLIVTMMVAMMLATGFNSRVFAFDKNQNNTNNTQNTLSNKLEKKGPSYYTVEFTYDELQYVMNGNSSVKLQEILDYLEISGTVDKVEVSNEDLLVVTKENGEYIITSEKAFSSKE